MVQSDCYLHSRSLAVVRPGEIPGFLQPIQADSEFFCLVGVFFKIPVVVKTEVSERGYIGQILAYTTTRMMIGAVPITPFHKTLWVRL